MPMKHAKKALRMGDGEAVDIIIDADVEGFEPPQRIDEAVRVACAVAGNITGETIAVPHVCIRFAADAEIQALNRQWRDKDSVTDVLSFPMQEAPFDAAESLGDIALAVAFVGQEAARLERPLAAHCLHLIIHATLHLLGFDHIDDAEAMQMQQLEKEAMQRMGLHDPYPDLAEACP